MEKVDIQGQYYKIGLRGKVFKYDDAIEEWVRSFNFEPKEVLHKMSLKGRPTRVEDQREIEASQMVVDKVISYQIKCMKAVKLRSSGLNNKEVAVVIGCSPTHVVKLISDYKLKG